MKYEILEIYGIDKVRFVALVTAFSISVFIVSLFLTLRLIGTTGIAFSVILGIVSGYILFTEPLRVARYSSLIQSEEASTFFSFISTAHSVTGSRTRPIMLLEPRDFSFSNAIVKMKRSILLGRDLEGTIQILERESFSSTLSSALSAYKSRSGWKRIEWEEEYSASISTSLLTHETKVPLFIAAVFFSPILLTFLSITSHLYSSSHLLYIFLFNLVLVDLAYFYSSSERRILE